MEKREREGEKKENALRASEERTYRDVNQLVIKISEGFALNGPVTFIRPRFFDELSRERAPRLVSSGALSVFRYSRAAYSLRISVVASLWCCFGLPPLFRFFLTRVPTTGALPLPRACGKRRSELFWLSIWSRVIGSFDLIWIIPTRCYWNFYVTNLKKCI